MRNLDDVHKVERPVQKQFAQKTFPVKDDFHKEKPQIRVHIIPAIEETQQLLSVSQPLKPRQLFVRNFKVAVLTVFTLFVLGVGAFFGGRFVSLAHDVSTSQQGIYKTVSDNIGSALGPFIPAFKNLDNSNVAVAIREGRRLNVLLLGYGGAGHEGSLLTDTMMVLSIDFSANKVTYIPVPRDTWIKIPTRGYDGAFAKINSAYAAGYDNKNYPDKLPQFTGPDGGGNMAMYEVSQVLGVPVDYYASVDFYAFQHIVDILGGVEVNVKNAFTDYSYPSGDQNVAADYCVADNIPDSMISNCRFKKVHFDTGLQFMDGATALEYARSRHALGVEGSDFSRSARQQNLISAVEQKALRIGALTKVLSLMDAVQGHLKTNLSIADIKDLADYLKSGKLDQKTGQISLTDSDHPQLTSSWSADRQWILIPAKGYDLETGKEDWNAIHQYIKDKLK
jgi:anionic cell wall polymer biosynthesis LytR-Cps2A-Psr (LCP) family protein